jgi:hypothetical protein
MSDHEPLPPRLPLALRELIEKESRAYESLIREGEKETAYAALQRTMALQSPSVSMPSTPYREVRSFERWHLSLAAAVIVFGILSAVFVLCGGKQTSPIIAAEQPDARSAVTQAQATTMEPAATSIMPRVSSAVPETPTTNKRRLPPHPIPHPVSTAPTPNASVSAAGTQSPR